jgi:hypothetical protein
MMIFESERGRKASAFNAGVQVQRLTRKKISDGWRGGAWLRVEFMESEEPRLPAVR